MRLLSAVAAVFMVTLLAPGRATAAEQSFDFKGQKVYYENGEHYETEDVGTGEKIHFLVFKQDGWFKPSKTATGRALVVGGGGAGGYGTTGTTNPGGGGGGGQVIDQDGLAYTANAKFSVTIGAGGTETSTETNGEDGHPSILANETTTLLTALGGGGGGAKADGNGTATGHNVATGGGGGGRIKSGVFGQGGRGTLYDGGNAASSNRSGGGGGAGGKGGNATTGSGSVSGDGGIGVTLNEDVWAPVTIGIPASLGGGGGGGQSSNATIDYAGEGHDGGGTGGRQNNAPEPGLPNTGGGGGGGGRCAKTHTSNARFGAAGGSGIVVIRFDDIEMSINWVSIDVTAGGNSGKIFVDENASYSWKGGDLIIAYSNTMARGGLCFAAPTPELQAQYPNLPPIWANARILEIGGGGGGGMIGTLGSGGGAGGGAGGFVEQAGLVFDNRVEFQVTVGAGGAGGKTHKAAGKPGKDSSVTTNGVPVIVVAKGGGGGGAHSAGGDGASGGGGSRAPVAEGGDMPGGATTAADQGHPGGAGAGAYRGAGGGGAGGKGGDVEGEIAGAGGIGRECDITGVTLIYAGGGGGAYVNLNDSINDKHLGGDGGSFDAAANRNVGGNGAGVGGGATGKELNPVPAQDGMDGRGGGGGGGVSYDGAAETAGNGGNGVVIIRLSGFVVRDIPVPGTRTFTYDGKEHVGVDPFFAYTFKTNANDRTTWSVGVDADNYAVTINIAADAPYGWGDVAPTDPTYRGDRVVRWKINQRVVNRPEVTESFVYDATEHIAVDADLLHLDAQGYCYTDDALRLKFCQLTPTHRETNVAPGAHPGGWYTFDAVLTTYYDDNNQHVTNFVWDSGSMAAVKYHWQITQAKNEIRGLNYPPLKTTRLKNPLDCFTCDWPKKNGTGDVKMKLGENVIVEYSPCVGGEPTGEWTAWTQAATGKGPTVAGTYVIRVTIPETDNWAGAVDTQIFGTWVNTADIFADQMPISVTAASALSNFPVPVKLHEPEKDGYSEMSGFSYLRAGLDGTEIQFFDSYGDPIPHEVELWNIRGESVVWVKLPSVSTSKTTFTMCWKRVSDVYLRPYDGGAVWRDTYCGVWHMSRLEEGRLPDATGNGHSAYFTGDADWEFIDKEKKAPMGNAVYLKSGDILVDGGYPYPEGTLTNRFTYTGWYQYPDFAVDAGFNNDKPIGPGNRIFAGTKADAETINKARPLAGWALRMVNSQYYASWLTTGVDWHWNWGANSWNMKTTWGYFGYKANYLTPTATKGAGVCRYYAYADAFNENGTDHITYYVNGSDRPLQLASAGFYVDEVRLSTNALSTAWLKEEYNTLHKANYCVNGLVKIDCHLYNSGAGLTCDWWSTVPSLGKTMWKQGESAPSVAKGTYKGAGTAISYSCKDLKTGTATTNKMPTAVGYYRATFDHSSPVSYRPQAHSIDFYIIENVQPTKDLGGSASGRVLLMNADNNALGPVTNQGWCATDETGATFWRRIDDTAGVVSNNVLPGTRFELVRSEDSKVLWQLENCRQGNTFTTNSLMLKGQNYLPASHSGTALSVTNESVRALTKADTGWLMLRNVEGAAVTSGVFTNGVGTIYFDAVNQKAVATDFCRLVVELATAETAAALEVPAAALDWREVDLCALWYQNTTGAASKDLDATKELALVETKGASVASEGFFYRVHAQVNVHRPTRVRIRRTTFDENSGADDAMILMDNLIVSPPATSAELVPYGKFDTELIGVQVVGMGGAFVPPFPSAGAPAPKGRARVKLPAGCAYAGQSPDTYLSLAQMLYRRRYLGAFEGSGDWQVAMMQGAGSDAVETLEPLALEMETGDVEFRFVAVMKSPFYGYVDYSNKISTKDKVTQAGTFTEEDALKESQYEVPDADTRLASLGEDWFVRIRRSASDWERTEVQLDGAIKGLWPMELMDDGTWRALVRIPVDAKEGAACTFKFNGWNLQTPGATDYAFNKTSWGGGGTVAELPNNGVLAENGEVTTFSLDHKSGWLEFRLRLGADAKIWSIARAEYQDFNSWNDAHTTADIFHVNDVLTNGVDDVKMLARTNDWSKYTPFESENDGWNETFYTADYAKDFPLDVVQDQVPKMPNGMYHGRYLSFVHKALAAQNREGLDAGLAGKLLGQGKGMIDFLGSETMSPDGIDEISFKARIGQSATFDGIGYAVGGLGRDNYMFFAQSTMSGACNIDGKSLGDMAVGASISLIGYYFPYQGCYEFRVERPYLNQEYTMKILKWRNVSGAMTCETLATRRFTNQAYAWTDEEAEKADAPKGRFGFFISCKTQDDGSTQIVGGLSKAPHGPDKTYPARAYSDGNFNGLVVVDKDNNFTWGSYGVMSKDCPAQFLLPIVFKEPLAKLPSTSQIVANKSWSFEDQSVTLNGANDATKFDQCRDEINSARKWALPAMRLERYTVPGDFVGLRAPIDLQQQTIVQLRRQGSSSELDWQTVFDENVSSYALVEKRISLRKTGRWDVRYTTGSNSVDVVYTDIVQTRWHAADDLNLSSRSEDFTYTQALMLTNTVSRNRELVLQPARADADKPVSLRSPMLGGLGKLTFAYKNADENAQIWVQMATNAVSASTLSNVGGYNQSVTEGGDVGQWITVRKFGPYAAGCDEELGEKGVRTVYLGYHDDGTKDRPHYGVMRLFVPVTVVKKAVDLATNETQVTTYGKVTVTAVQATDEPALSERAWRGWNLRTVGDATDSERRMYLSDATLKGDLGYGLSGALNNTADAHTIVEVDDDLKARTCPPTIFSPTFGAEGGGRTGIGAVSFKARIYERPGEVAPPGRIVVWGASNNVDAKWTLIGTNEIVSTVFSNFTWTTGGSYSAIKFELASEGYRRGVVDTGRVILDEVLISEKVQPSITFDYARPFRMNLGTHKPIVDILSRDEQPLAGESWGVQTKLTLKQLEDEVDVTKGFKVYLSYYRGESPWGYEQWRDSPDAVVRQELELVGDASNLVFRSNVETPTTLVPPAATGGQVVQFMLEAEYHTSDGGAEAKSQPLTQGMWKQPEWYYPVDYNATHGGDRDETKFAAYALIDTVSPGRAWINEVNWNDGMKSETGGTLSKTNQYVEVCVPAGVDMTGWYVKVTGVGTDPTTGGKKSGKLFTFGKWGVPSSKNTGRAVNGYEFMFVQSPDSRDANTTGGVKDFFGNPADGTWSDADQVGMTRGTLSYYQPYQFELYRPSGVLEHQFVLEGTNSATLLSGSMYAGTNLVAELNRFELANQGFASPKRFYAGEEKARRKNGALYGSTGVVGGTATGDPAPGEDGTWSVGLQFTPGGLNEGQVIPAGWFLPPNGTNSWVYASVVGEHLHQKIGDDTSRSILVIVPQGGSTNIQYTVDNFYELDSVAVNGVTNETFRHKPHVCNFEIKSPTGTLYVVATEGVDNRLLTNWRLGPENPFTPSILHWLSAHPEWADKDIDDMVPAHYQLVDNNAAPKCELGLNDMYWLDIPPFTDSGEPEWLLRVGVKDMQYPVVRQMYGRKYTNLVFTVKMYVENDHTFETNRVVKMQGLDDSRSNDPTTYDVWNSQTFKIRGALKMSDKPLPFRAFIFDENSFDANYKARIEVMDPWSPASPGYSYGWDLHPESKGSSFWCTTMDTDTQPMTIEVLKAESVFGD